MRINIYAEELMFPEDARSIEVVQKLADTGKTFFGVRLFLYSSEFLHHGLDDDDRSAITIWGPREKIAALLRKMADGIESAKLEDEPQP